MRSRKYNSGHQLEIDSLSWRSGLKHWNAACKVCFSLLALIVVITADSVLISLMTLLYMGVLSCFAGKLRVRVYLRFLCIPAAFILMSGLAILIQFGSGDGSIFRIPILSVYAYVTKHSLTQTVSLSIKALGGVSCLLFLTLSTPMGEIINVLGRAGIPAVLLELMHFIYRYIFILLEMNSRQKDAVRSRLGYSSRKTALRIFGCEMANLFVVSMKRAQSYYDALESRGGEGNYLFWEEKRKLHGSQIGCVILYLGLAAFLIAVRHLAEGGS